MSSVGKRFGFPRSNTEQGQVPTRHSIGSVEMMPYQQASDVKDASLFTEVDPVKESHHSSHDPDEIVLDPALEASITRRCDTHILPWIFILWLLAFIDRSNIGNARLDGLTTDLHMTTTTSYNTALAVFYTLYVLLDIPSNWVLKKVGGGWYLPALGVCWGIVGTCMGAVKSYGGLIALRILLGACEGGMFGYVALPITPVPPQPH